MIELLGGQVTAVGQSAAAPVIHEPSGHGTLSAGGTSWVTGQSAVERAQVESWQRTGLVNGQVKPCGHSAKVFAQAIPAAD